MPVIACTRLPGFVEELFRFVAPSQMHFSLGLSGREPIAVPLMLPGTFPVWNTRMRRLVRPRLISRRRQALGRAVKSSPNQVDAGHKNEIGFQELINVLPKPQGWNL